MRGVRPPWGSTMPSIWSGWGWFHTEPKKTRCRGPWPDGLLAAASPKFPFDPGRSRKTELGWAGAGLLSEGTCRRASREEAR